VSIRILSTVPIKKLSVSYIQLIEPLGGHLTTSEPVSTSWLYFFVEVGFISGWKNSLIITPLGLIFPLLELNFLPARLNFFPKMISGRKNSLVITFARLIFLLMGLNFPQMGLKFLPEMATDGIINHKIYVIWRRKII
jgi:hypothetical protein